MRIDHLVLYTVPVIVLFLFATMRSRTAMIVAFLGAWLFLPQAGLKISGLPDYTRVTATSASVLLCVLLFDADRLLSLRPRWYDLPITIVCLAPLIASLSNGLGLYDGLSEMTYAVATWGVPYLLGRAYLNDLEGLRELALAIVIGGLIYLPLCLFEIRFSPQLHRMVYGSHQHQFAQTIRAGGFRPTVFMQHGLAVGLWMGGATVIGYWLWASGALKRLQGLSFGPIVLALAVTAVLCKSSGALTLMALGLALWPILSRPSLARIILLVLLLCSPVYIGARGLGLWSGDNIIEISRSVFGDDRADSLQFRIANESMLAEKAIQRPLFGWGGWSRSRIFNEKGEDISVTDSLWIIKLGTEGLTGLSAITATLLLPMILLWWRSPITTWRHPKIAPAAVLACLVTLYMVDNLFNAMFNPIYLLAAGGLMGLNVQRAGQGKIVELVNLGRSLKKQGQCSEAASAWYQALEIWNVDPPKNDSERRDLANVCNDLAWLLAIDPASPVYDPPEAVRLAEAAVVADSSSGTYWNTLGLTRFRKNDLEDAIDALRRSIELTDGTAFDDLLLALAFYRQGQIDQARFHYERARATPVMPAMQPHDLLLLQAETPVALLQ